MALNARSSSPEAAARYDKAALAAAGGGFTTAITPWFEGISDGTFNAFMTNKSGRMRTAAFPQAFYDLHCHGPFCLRQGRFPDAYVNSRRGTYSWRERIVVVEGRPLSCLIAREETPGGKGVYREICFDPSVGSLVRQMRSVTTLASGEHNVEDFGLTATFAGDGFFLPAAFIETRYRVSMTSDAFAKLAPDANLPAPNSRSIYARVFRAKGFRPFREEPTFGGPTKQILAQGGLVNLDTDTADLSLSKIKSLVGQKVYSVPKPPRITTAGDNAEFQKFTAINADFRKPESYSNWLRSGIALSLFAILLVGGWTLRRRCRKTAVVVLLSCFAQGCSNRNAPKGTPSVAISFGKSFCIKEADMPVVHEALLVTNTGNTSITVSRIDANCNCTLPAQKDLPFRLAPHHVKSVEVELRKADYNVQMLNFGFETEFGRIPAQTLLTIVPRTIVTPSTVMTGVEEGETAEIEFSFREVAEQGKNTRPVGSCRCDGIHCTIKSETEAPGPADGLHFRETRIVAKVIGTTPGIHDATLLLKEKANEANVLGKAALRYECRRYVSCMPEKAYLAQKELRVFLRCRDGGVGVAKIAFVPDGIRAVLTGPREIIVFPPTNNSTRVVGDIVVETTSARQKTLRIPVVHSPTPPSGE